MKPNRTIWLLALGYFAAYVPYSALIKIYTKQVSGLELLPGVIFGTVAAALVCLVALGWGRHAAIPRRTIVVSGIGTAAIIGTTTIAYTFQGISIVLALLLMRGGVLILAPLVDLAFGRRVRWFSWAALALTFAALGIALANIEAKVLTIAATINLGVYLSGYVLRLPAMTRVAKIADQDVTRTFFVRELLVALTVLLAAPATYALLASGRAAEELRRGFTLALPAAAIVGSVMIGVFYATLYFFGTLIYLDRRENTFCIPLNRGASMLAGVAASFAMLAPPPASQLVAASFILLALGLLSPLHHIPEHAFNLRAILREREAMPVPVPLRMSRMFLFVCSGNTCRSAMAEAIGNAELAANVGRAEARHDRRAEARPTCFSAGVTAKDGVPMPENAVAALQRIEIAAPEHRSRKLTPEIAEAAEVIYCMTAKHRDDVVAAIPAAAEKTRCLDPAGDIEDPIGGPLDVYVACASRMQRLIRERFDELGVGA